MRRIQSVGTGALAALALVVISPESVEAQTTLGVRGGVSVASVSFDDDTFDESNRTGFTGGAFLDFNSGDLLGFQVGLQYSQKGAELDLGDVVDELSLSYLEIPAIVKLGLPLENLKPSVFGGVGLGFNTGCDIGDGSDSDCGDDVKSTEFMGIFGADVAFYLGSFSLWVDGRYHVGLSDVTDSESFEDLKNKNWAFQAGVGFPLGGS